MKHYCPQCNRTKCFEVTIPADRGGSLYMFDTFMADLRCRNCGKKFKVEALMRKCRRCRRSQPHAVHRTLETKKIFAYTCLQCELYGEA